MRHLWNSDYKSTCIVHPGAHTPHDLQPDPCLSASCFVSLAAIQVHSIASLLFYMLLLFALGVFYEWSRLVPARLEARFRASESYKVSARSSRSTDHVHAPLLGERDRSGTPIPLIRLVLHESRSTSRKADRRQSTDQRRSLCLREYREVLCILSMSHYRKSDLI